jgi:outer membrane protein
MKRVLIFCILILGAQNLFAQGVKIGFIYSDTVLISMTEYEEAKNKIETYSSQLSAQLKSKGQEFEEKAQDFEKNSGTWAEPIVTDKREELVRLENNIRDFQQQAETKMRNKENEVLNPLYAKIEIAIKEIAVAEGYDYVTPSQVFLFANEDHNLTDKIIAKLGGTKPTGN